MLWIILGLMGISFVMLIVGGITLLIFQGRTQYRQGRDVGQEVMNSIADDSLTQQRSYQKSFFVGQGVEVRRETTISFAELKHQMGTGHLWYTIVALTTILGFMGVLFFLAILILFLMPNLIGLIFALGIFYQLLRMVIDFIRA